MTIKPNLYKGRARNIALAVKKSKDLRLFKEIADFLSRQVNECDIIVPAPNHYGFADYTLDIAEIVSEFTGAKVVDCLKVFPHVPLYENKSQELEFHLCGVVPNGRIFLLDNVIDTGKTFLCAKKLIPSIKPLMYATTNKFMYDVGSVEVL